MMLLRIALGVELAIKISTPIYFYRVNEGSVTVRVKETIGYSLRSFNILKTWFDLSSPYQRAGFCSHAQRLFVSMFLFSKDWRIHKTALCSISNRIRQAGPPFSLGYRLCDCSNRLPFVMREISHLLLLWLQNVRLAFRRS